jgi:hypothetical protein
MDVQEEMLEGPGMQQWHKGPRPETAAMRQQTATMSEGEDNHKWHRRVEFRAAITSGKRRNAQENPIQDFQREDRETSSQNFQRIMKNNGLNTVEGSARLKQKRGCTWSRSSKCSSTSHCRSYGPQWEREKQGKPLDDSNATWMGSHLTRGLLKMSDLKEGVGGTGWRVVTIGRKNHHQASSRE